MKKIALLLALLTLVLFASASLAEYATVPYKQYSSGGTTADLEAVILFENKNSMMWRPCPGWMV